LESIEIATILSVPFCPIPFCPVGNIYWMNARLCTVSVMSLPICYGVLLNALNLASVKNGVHLGQLK